MAPDQAQRPILAGFHPDPSICRAADGYYLVTSSFEYVPGVPIYRSRDLQDWEQVGHVLDRRSQLDVSRAAPSGGIFAPTLRYHDGCFYLITTNVSDGGGHLLVTATDPAGPWSDPIRMPGLPGIDPDLAWDADGTCYLTWSGYREHRPIGIVQAILDPRTGAVHSGPQLIWKGTGGQYPEGPHLHARGGVWYLVIAEGGTERGHLVAVARGPSPAGPFESHAGNPILTRRSTSSPVQGTGHADLVQRYDGSWAAVYLGCRPRGGNAGWCPLGREVFAQEVVWTDGWPSLAAPILPGGPARICSNDGTAMAQLAPVWASPRRHPRELISRTPHGWRITHDPGSEDAALVGRRQQHLFCRVRAELDAASGTGGLSLWIDPHHRYDLEVTGRTIRAIARIGSIRHVIAECAWTGATLQLHTEPAIASPQQSSAGPDVVVLSAGSTELARLDGRYLSTEVAGGFTGRMVGVHASSGHVTLTSWEYAGDDDGSP
jgi:hypothetical protein